jgi:hypothetical protein
MPSPIDTMLGSNNLDYKKGPSHDADRNSTTQGHNGMQPKPMRSMPNARQLSGSTNSTKGKDKAKDPSRRVHTSSRITTNEQGLKEVEEESSEEAGEDAQGVRKTNAERSKEEGRHRLSSNSRLNEDFYGLIIIQE